MLAGIVLLWQFVIAPSVEVIASPSEIVETLVDQWDSFATHTLATAQEAALGFVTGCTFAIALALISLLSSSVEASILRLGLALYSVPIIVVAPLIVIWLGSGQRPRIALSALAVFFVVLVNTIRGFRSASRESHELLRVCSASRLQVLRLLRVPSALPYIMSALKVAAPAAVLGAIIGEWINANEGLGVVIFFSLYQFEVPRLWAAMVLTTAIAIAGYMLVGLAERIFMPWHESVRVGRLETG